MYRKTKKIIGLILAIVVVTGALSTPFQEFSSIPLQLRLFEGQMANLNVSSLIETVLDDNQEVIAVSGTEIQTLRTGMTDITFKLFGLLPIKRVQVQVLPETKLYPGGHSIGVKLKSEGVMVVGFYLVDVEDKKVSPGEQANLRVGDYILSINGQKVSDVSSITNFVDGNRKLEMEVKRNDRIFTTTVEPQLDSKTNNHRLGLYIRDSAAGVGTLTFYDPKTNMYGALGHVITDMDTGQPIEVGSGEIFSSRVTSIDKGQKGKPGEKKCTIGSDSDRLGNILANNSLGIYGKLTDIPNDYFGDAPLPIALAHDVKTGPAHIYTVVKGEKVERFDIEIVNVIPQRFSSTKGMVIRVTDERLLAITGGIIQGMSGSPIIQDGKIVGAVTHVFVNDPTMGYGCYIEWMLKEAIENKDINKAA
ncbi:SpoIVB peptidase [Desulfuribacillus alkaliarsenatis]|uniref:SpoIVB peptidase n=1 Tax=Desulfuribacillus alkaliarsenatis TaxID=766136 RepID=A0A1E5G5L2_9FIRM|nr:SpoIVB peptidase [Desulfuribacillus alkaliarsenatis]OEF98456.1 SpoIVB peptidase [Desulfuribacillus alkaliarsenatis]